MARIAGVLFICFLLFSTLWAAPIQKPSKYFEKNAFRALVNRAVANRAVAVAAPALGGAITCDGTIVYRDAAHFFFFVVQVASSSSPGPKTTLPRTALRPTLRHS